MHILVTAGPTREHLDPIRFISNRSSGKMGYAIAQRAVARNHRVTLVSGPVALAAPEAVELLPVVSARDMLAAVERCLPACDALIMCAAVADWRPREMAPGKLKKNTMQPVIELVPNPDILSTIAPLKGQRTFIGFAAETDDLIANATDKLIRKGLDMIVANDVSAADAGFGVDTNRVSLLTPSAAPRHLPLMGKEEVADAILDWLEKTVAANARR